MTNDATDDTRPLAVDTHGGWVEVLRKLADGVDLSRTETSAAGHDILSGRATDAQLAAFIVALRIKGETVDEMLGLREAMMAEATPLHVAADAVDLVGTGGSAHRRQHALNVSTMATIAASAAGATMCKHGNVKASSTSGAFDFLGTLGIRIDIAPERLERCVAELGCGFAWAKTFHPAMRFAGPVRSQIGVPTVFNQLGPMAHPGALTRQVIGAADVDVAAKLAEVLRGSGSEHAWVVAGADGLDELSTTGTNTVFEVRPDGVTPTEIAPGDVDLATVTLDDLAGGDAERNVGLFRGLLDDPTGPVGDIVCLNAGAALVVAGRVDQLGDGVAAARAAFADGAVGALVERLTVFTNEA